MNSLRTLFNPAIHHPPGRRRPFFEGWYYKVVNSDEDRRYAIIPGVFYGETPAQDHAFVQVMDGRSASVVMQKYAIDQFNPSAQKFDLMVGPNHFTGNSLALDISTADLNVRGNLQFNNTQPWPVTLTSPGIMGWYAYIPFMQCNHGVLSLDHTIQGSLTINGKETDFTGGRGYIEKDWGESFPDAWVWTQSNHFDLVGTSLTASIAIIPWLKSAFPGFIIGLLHEGILHRFTTYNGSRVETLKPGEKHIDWVVRNKSHRLSLHIERSQSLDLYAPTRTDMSGRVAESIDARIKLQLHALEGGREHLVYEDLGRNAGLEVSGDIDRLLRLWES